MRAVATRSCFMVSVRLPIDDEVHTADRSTDIQTVRRSRA
jgi:hypothetical protein